LLAPRPEWNADHTSCLEVAKAADPLGARCLFERGPDPEAAAFDRCANLGLGVVVRPAGAGGLCQLGPRDRSAAELACLLDHVDHTPVREVGDNEVRDPCERGVHAGRRRQLVPRAPQEVEPCLALVAVGDSVTLSGLQRLPAVFAPLELADVLQERLRVERLALRIADGRAVLADPDRAALARE